MKARIKSRLERLEHDDRGHRLGVREQIQKMALQAVSDEDLDHLSKVVGRGEPFSACTGQEQSALDRYYTEYEAALRITSRSLL